MIFSRHKLHRFLLSLFLFLGLNLLFFVFPKEVSAAVLYEDNFDDNDASDWTIFGPPTNWVVVSDEYGISIPGNFQVTNTVPPDERWDESWEDFTYELDMRTVSGVDKNVIFRFQDNNNWYGIHQGLGGHMHVEKIVNGTRYDNQFQPTTYYLQNGANYHFRFSVQDRDFKVYINDTLVFDVIDSDPVLEFGKIGLRAGTGAVANTEVWFDNVIVCDDPTQPCEPTVTPTSTPTPTPTPTSTPTLTPTPIPSPSASPLVVVLPGLGASWNPEAILSCDLNTGGDWMMAPYAERYYQPILTTLTNAGVEHTFFAYDWRQQVTNTADALASFLNRQLDAGQSANLVGHSLGGLVSRAYLEKQQENHRLNKLLTVGSPHRGTARAYQIWEGGQIWNDNFLQKLANNILLRHCGEGKKTNRQVIQSLVPSFKDILPIDLYLKEQKTDSFIPIKDMHEKNDWLLKSALSLPINGVDFGTLSGNDFQTLKNIKVKPPNRLDNLLGNWVDGRPTRKEKVKTGDGTVLTESSQLAGAPDVTINLNHGNLIASSEGIGKIFEFLGINVTPLSIYTEPESALLIIAYPGESEVIGPKSLVEKDNRGMIAILDPAKGKYKLKIKPEKETTFVAVGQLVGDKFFWKEYELKGKKERQGEIEFDPKSPKENPLKL